MLFPIECNIKQLGKNVIFADIAQYSEYSNEEYGAVQLISMKASCDGETTITDYLELIHRKTEEKSVSIIFGRLMWDLGQHDKSQKYFEQLLKDPNGKDISWIEFNIGRALHFKSEWNYKLARIKDSACVLNNIGGVFHDQDKFEEAFHHYQRSL